MTDNQQDAVTVTETPSIGSLSIFASAGAERKAMPFLQDPSIVDWVEVESTPWWRWPRGRVNRKYSCGHRGVNSFTIRIWGDQLKPNPKRSNALCPECNLEVLKKVAIRCCLCGFPIVPAEAIAAYNAESIKPKDFDFKVIDRLAIGCMRWNCGPSGGFFSGYWNGEGVHWLEEE